MVTHSITSSRVLYLVAEIAAFLVAVFAALYYTANIAQHQKSERKH
jgi:hypothetical protein